MIYVCNIGPVSPFFGQHLFANTLCNGQLHHGHPHLLERWCMAASWPDGAHLTPKNPTEKGPTG